MTVAATTNGLGHLALGVNIDHVATLRQARRIHYPSPLRRPWLPSPQEPTTSRCHCARIVAISKMPMSRRYGHRSRPA